MAFSSFFRGFPFFSAFSSFFRGFLFFSAFSSFFSSPLPYLRLLISCFPPSHSSFSLLRLALASISSSFPSTCSPFPSRFTVARPSSPSPSGSASFPVSVFPTSRRVSSCCFLALSYSFAALPLLPPARGSLTSLFLALVVSCNYSHAPYLDEVYATARAVSSAQCAAQQRTGPRFFGVCSTMEW